MSEKLQCDALIFDMDGTLWDAVDSYARIWNTTLEQAGITDVAQVTRQTLMREMGKHLEDIIKDLVPGHDRDGRFLQLLNDNEATMMPGLRGRLYDGVTEAIPELARRLPLFMVSNCGPLGLENFLDVNGLRPYIKDALSHGGTGLDKAGNITLLVHKYGLKHPVYVGDTQGDSDAAHAAGAKMIYCAYGFGNVKDPDAVIHCFGELESIV